MPAWASCCAWAVAAVGVGSRRWGPWSSTWPCRAACPWGLPLAQVAGHCPGLRVRVCGVRTCVYAIHRFLLLKHHALSYVPGIERHASVNLTTCQASRASCVGLLDMQVQKGIAQSTHAPPHMLCMKNMFVTTGLPPC
eukprot:1143536-Pelagomonas_calceolata.AAC.2